MSNRAKLDALLATIQVPAWSFPVLVHLAAVAPALDIIGLNLAGLFIGKELQGPISQDGTKMLALQVTAKLHELLMLSSLSYILWSLLLDLLMNEDGIPFGALSVGDKFSDISYLWSTEFRAACSARFRSKYLFLPICVLFTILGVILGPSTATAMAPSLDNWPAGSICVPLNLSDDKLRPMKLDSTNLPDFGCTESRQRCSINPTWQSVATNVFSYWGQTTFGGLRGMPELAAAPGSEAVRTMRVRFRGPSSLYQPEYSTTTIQPVWAANLVNGLRLLWFSNNAKRCDRGQTAYCNYKDITWSIATPQPVVRTSCLPRNSHDPLRFPIMSHQSDPPEAMTVSMPFPDFEDELKLQTHWVPLEQPAFTQVSAGVIIRMQSPTSGAADLMFTCSIDAAWSKSSTSSTFSGSPFVVDGYPQEFFLRDSRASDHNLSRVHISAEWAQGLNPVIDSSTDRTAFDLLYLSGQVPSSDEAAKPKVEAIMSILVAEGMSWIAAESDIVYDYNASGLSSLSWSTVKDLDSPSNASTITFQTAVTGYSYGIRTANGFAKGRFLAIFCLMFYCTIVFTYSVSVVLRDCDIVTMWNSMLDIVVLALHSAQWKSDSVGSHQKLLRRIVRITMMNGEYSISIDNGSGQTSSYHKLRPEEVSS